MTNDKIVITKENISSSYNESTYLSKISLLNEIKLNFSIVNENNPFYIIGNISNDNGDSLVNIYSYYFGKENFLYSVKSNNDGCFILGKLYPLLSFEIYDLNIEIYKIKNNFNSIQL